MGVEGQGGGAQLVVIMIVAQQTMPEPHADVVVQLTPPSVPPLELPPPELLPPPLLLAVASVGDPESVGAAGGLLLLEPQATASETAAQPDTAHKIIEFFILKTSLLSLEEPQAARV
jgi:hypothetical protein